MEESTLNLTVRTCTRCGEEKSLHDFQQNPRYRGGYTRICKACLSDYALQWRKRNVERERERHRRNYQEHPERRREAVRRSYQKHREKRRAETHDWYVANREHVAEYDRKRREEMGDRAVLLSRESGARQRFAKAGLVAEVVDYQEILSRDGYHCYLCDCPISPQALSAVEFDHVIPVIHGGSHTMENIRVTHRNCNKRKWNLSLVEFQSREAA